MRRCVVMLAGAQAFLGAAVLDAFSLLPMQRPQSEAEARAPLVCSFRCLRLAEGSGLWQRLLPRLRSLRTSACTQEIS